MNYNNRYTTELNKLKDASNFRVLPNLVNNNLIDLCSNDYLGLNSNTDLYESFISSNNVNALKFSASSSRLLSGNNSEYQSLEKNIQLAYGKEACLIFNSGYHANIGILPALAGKKDLIIADKLVHASLIDGIKLSSAKFERYKHLDYLHLENLLKKHRYNYENVFIVSESVFSMDGDIADLNQLIALKNTYNCMLYIDEAHAVGAMGETGLGYAEKANAINEIEFIVGTFGKALASVGAYLVCDKIFKEYLVNHSRSLIFTTALPPINLAWTTYIFKQLPNLSDQRLHLKKLSKQFADLMEVKCESHIIPFIVGANSKAIELCELLVSRGFNVKPIRYPTVPKNTARLRFSLNSNLKIEQLQPIKNIVKKHE